MLRGVGWIGVFLLSHLMIGVGSAEIMVEKEINGVRYRLVEVSPKRVKIYWKNDQGQIMRTFREVEKHLAARGENAELLINGGIFEPGGIPTGLLVQRGKTMVPINRKKGRGNFYLNPNGVFLIGSGGARVIGTDEYPLRKMKVQEAVQSGPLLLRDGKVHPAFNQSSKNRLHRNGVGVNAEGKVVFLMSDFHSPKFPNLFDFSQAFRSLGCKDALFLDGDISQMRMVGKSKKAGNPFGSVIAIMNAETTGAVTP